MYFLRCLGKVHIDQIMRGQFKLCIVIKIKLKKWYVYR